MSSKQSLDPALGLYGSQRGGHRDHYVAFCETTLNGRVLDAWPLLWTRKPVLFLFIEDDFSFYIFAALIRACLLRKTAGLLFRPKPAIEGRSLRLRLKRGLLRLLNAIPRVSTLTLLPLDLIPQCDRLAAGWIYDFQLWDLSVDERRVYEKARLAQGAGEQNSLHHRITHRAAGRKVVASLGAQNRIKGSDHFMRLYARDASLSAHSLFVACGKVYDDVKPQVEDFLRAGGMQEPRFLSDEEVLQVYASSDAVWCVYAPDYDQASGILGRAVQLGVPVVVREGSLLEKLCQREGVQYFSCRAEEGFDPLAVHSVTTCSTDALIQRFRAQSLENLSRALGIPLPEVSLPARYTEEGVV